MRTGNFRSWINRSLPLVLLATISLSPATCPALEPDEILVLANVRSPRSVALARYYMTRRKIPRDRLLLLWVTDDETCSREEYNDLVATPVRKHLLAHKSSRSVRCLLIMYGFPLKVAPPEMNMKERVPRKGPMGDQWASLDSEIALVLAEDYLLSGWIPNPHFIGGKQFCLENPNREALMVSRLDAPSVAIVRRIIEDSLEVEEKGLEGTAYFDARWSGTHGNDKTGKKSGYGYFDRSIHQAADMARKSGNVSVVLDAKQALFQPGTCPKAALYCGWYSLARYVDAFEWVRGSVGYHVASSECSTLKKRKSRVWCKMMLEKGVAVTLGPVNEPYLASFPLPEVFFGLLLKGSMSLAECYAASNPFLSWKMVLIGDPLYRPFKENPAHTR